MEQQKKRMAALEAVLFAMGEPVSLQVVAKALELNFAAALETVEALKAAYQNEERGIQLIELEGSYQLGTKPEYYENLITVAAAPEKPVLTETLMETLSIVAYRQPVTKAEINRIRGVSSDHAVSRLVEYGLIQEAGRLNAPGRPMLFATTREFLRRFGMDSLEQLPKQPEKMLEKTTEQVQADEIQEAEKETLCVAKVKNDVGEGIDESERPVTQSRVDLKEDSEEDVLDKMKKMSIKEVIDETESRSADELIDETEPWSADEAIDETESRSADEAMDELVSRLTTELSETWKVSPANGIAEDDLSHVDALMEELMGEDSISSEDSDSADLSDMERWIDELLKDNENDDEI